MPNFEEIEFHIKTLSSEEKMFLAKYVSRSEITAIFTTMKDTIAEEAKRRIQNKISTTFNKGYSTGGLFSSIFYSFEGNDLKISSTKNYFDILNRGYGAFDMKKAFMGNNVKMRLPGGKVIFRKCGPPYGENPSRKKYRQLSTSTADWIHPGYKGAHITEIVEDEMEEFINQYVRETLMRLVQIAKSRNQKALSDFTPQ